MSSPENFEFCGPVNLHVFVRGFADQSKEVTFVPYVTDDMCAATECTVTVVQFSCGYYDTLYDTVRRSFKVKQSEKR